MEDIYLSVERHSQQIKVLERDVKALREVQDLSLSHEKVLLKKGESFTLIPTITPSNATNKRCIVTPIEETPLGLCISMKKPVL